MDGLLLDTEAVAREAFIAATSPFGLARGAAFDAFAYFVGGNSSGARERLSRLLPGVDTNKIDRAWIREFEVLIAGGVPIKKTVVETLEQLSRLGVPMAVVTTSSRAHAEHNLGAAGLIGFFEGIVPGDEVGSRKPDPEPYRKGAALLSLPPELCAAFEDSDTGITAAMSAGCVGTQIPDLRPPDQPFPKLGQRFADTLADAVRGVGLIKG